MKITTAVATAALSAALLGGQETAVKTETFETRVAGPPPGLAHMAMLQGGPGTVQFIAAESAMPGKTVTGAPYSAEGVSEFTQVLADGTRINRTSSSKVARDSQGRTREERTMGVIGPWVQEGEAPRIVTIMDPVAREMYILNERERTARKMKLPDGDVMKISRGEPLPGNSQEKRVERIEQHVVVRGGSGVGVAAGGAYPPMASTANIVFRRGPNNSKAEQLGVQTMEGLKVEGTRVTHTIPAGEIGNDRVISSTVERWVSPELQVTVRSISKDPQMGETSYRLTGISREEPAKSLFQIPAGYKVEEGPQPMMFRRELKQ